MPTPSAIKKSAAKRAAYGAAFTALALLFGYVESLLPPIVPLPGVKLGLANAAVAVALYLLGGRPALGVNLARICLSAFLFGSLSTMVYSLSGAALSMALLIPLQKRTRLSPVTLCAVSGAAHNLGQLLCAMAVLHTAGLAYYLPALLLSGILAGAAVGLICTPVIGRLRAFFPKKEAEAR